MYVMFDSVDLAEIPRSAPAVAGYTSGAWPTFNSIVTRWPHAHHLSIAVSASHDAECLDIEKGDATPDQAPEWFRRQRARGEVKPVFYASQSQIAAVIAALDGAGIGRDSYRLWSAHYTRTPHICGPSEGVSWTADATQWTDRALGRNLDESLCVDDFFRPHVASPLDVLLEPERRLVNSYDHYMKHPREHAHGIKVTQRAMVGYRKAIWLAAVKGQGAHGPLQPGWGIHNRVARYRLLLARTKGLG